MQRTHSVGHTSGRVFRISSYGQPALVKLLNNALATYNLAAAARMLNLGAQLGVPGEEPVRGDRRVRPAELDE